MGLQMENPAGIFACLPVPDCKNPRGVQIPTNMSAIQPNFEAVKTGGIEFCNFAVVETKNRRLALIGQSEKRRPKEQLLAVLPERYRA
jgi:hypothetical protein